MPQHSLDIANGSGAAVRAAIIAALAALGSNQRGPNAPPAPIAGMTWVDDASPSSTVWTVRIFTGANWAVLGVLNTETNQFLARSALPIGATIEWPAPVLPGGYLWANGANVSRVTYAELFAAYGTQYGEGDGVNTFGVPDDRDRVVIGRGNMGGLAAARITAAISGIDTSVLGATGGDQRMQAHPHGVNDPWHGHPAGANVALVNAGIAVAAWSDHNTTWPNYLGYSGGSVATAAATGISIQSAGGGNSQNIQPGIVRNKIIYTGVF